MNARFDTPRAYSRAKIVVTYAASLLLFTVLAGFVVGVVRRLFPRLVPLYEPGALDVGSVVNLVVTAAVALLVYRHLAIRHPRDYWKAAIPIAIATAIGALICFGLLSPAPAKLLFLQLLLLVTAFQIAVAFLASFFRPKLTSPESPNKSFERTREG
jgi:hypothetical protein